MKKLTEPTRTKRNRQNRTETGQLPKPRSKLPKTHQDYWPSRLRKRTYLAPNGKTEIQIPTWQVRLFQGGQESWFNLNTANQAAAAAKARDIYVFLKANGWEATIAKFKIGAGGSSRTTLTVGEYFVAVEALAYLRDRTFLNYQSCFRTILSEAFGVKTTKSRFDYRKGGNKKWTDRIDDIRLERVTPQRVAKWQQKRLSAAGHAPTAIASAKRTTNSYIRCARSLFSREIRKRLKGLMMPTILPFDGIELYDGGSMKYVSKLHAPTLLAAADKELKKDEPEVYKIFLLGLCAGLRKAEIDSLEWRMLDFINNNINLEETEWLHLKSTDSAGQINVDAEILAQLRQYMPHSTSAFVISSKVTWVNGKKKHTHVRQPRNDSARAYYRCEPVFQRLNVWLRSKGIKANKPVHELRKEIGAMIATEHGIFAASQFLRHSDITTTARHYAAHKTRISVGLGKLLDVKLKPLLKPANASK